MTKPLLPRHAFGALNSVLRLFLNDHIIRFLPKKPCLFVVTSSKRNNSNDNNVTKRIKCVLYFYITDPIKMNKYKKLQEDCNLILREKKKDVSFNLPFVKLQIFQCRHSVDVLWMKSPFLLKINYKTPFTLISDITNYVFV